jgi:hypothetical protein
VSSVWLLQFRPSKTNRHQMDRSLLFLCIGRSTGKIVENFYDSIARGLIYSFYY